MYADFQDRYGRRVRVQESSIATEPCVWVLPEIHFHHASEEPICGAHLTPEQARIVIKALQEFVDECGE